MISSWPCPLHNGRIAEELIVRLGPDNGPALLIIPPFFAEHNLMRRQSVLIMRQLAELGFQSILPDLPGSNESLQPLSHQTLSHWRTAIDGAIEQFGISAILAIRSGALLAPAEAKGYLYAPQSGAKLLRGMVRAQSLSSRETGALQSSEELFEAGRSEGVSLGGWNIGPDMFRGLEAAEAPKIGSYLEIAQSDLTGPGLWLRAEPDEDEAQARQLAQLISDASAVPGTSK